MVSLDLGTTAGVSTWEAGRVTAEEWDLAGSKRDELAPLVGNTRALRPYRMYSRLGALLRTLSSPFVVFERIDFQRTVLAAQAYGGLRDAAIIACAEQGVPIMGVSPSTYRRAVLGTTQPDEAALLAFARQRYPMVVLRDKEHNAADSLVLLTYALDLPEWGSAAITSDLVSRQEKKPARKVRVPPAGQPF